MPGNKTGLDGYVLTLEKQHGDKTGEPVHCKEYGDQSPSISGLHYGESAIYLLKILLELQSFISRYI